VDYLGDFGCCCARRMHDQDMQTDPEILKRLPVYIQKPIRETSPEKEDSPTKITFEVGTQME
jgi:hypothetical protein